jgi:hypothetical protein
MAERLWSPAELERLIEQFRLTVFPLLSGKPPEIQGAVLADLTAIWLAGHVCVGNPTATADLRETLLDHHIAAVRDLIAVNARAMGTDG